MVRHLAPNSPGLAARLAGGGTAGTRPARPADPRLAAEGALAGVGDRPTRKGGIRQVIQPLQDP